MYSIVRLRLIIFSNTICPPLSNELSFVPYHSCHVWKRWQIYTVGCGNLSLYFRVVFLTNYCFFSFYLTKWGILNARKTLLKRNVVNILKRGKGKERVRKRHRKREKGEGKERERETEGGKEKNSGLRGLMYLLSKLKRIYCSMLVLKCWVPSSQYLTTGCVKGEDFEK